VRMREVLAAAGVPIPLGQVFQSEHQTLNECLRSRRLIVKPSNSFGSCGIDLDSIVDTEEQLRGRVAEVLRVYGLPLVEEFIAGRELTVAVIGSGHRAEALPPLEVVFGELFPPDRQIRTHEAKADLLSPYYDAFTISCPAALAPDVARRCQAVGLAAYRACHCNGYGRVDIRLRQDEPIVLEVNANCSLEYGEQDRDWALLPFAAQAAGLNFPLLLQRLLEEAFIDHHAPPDAD